MTTATITYTDGRTLPTLEIVLIAVAAVVVLALVAFLLWRRRRSRPRRAAHGTAAP